MVWDLRGALLKKQEVESARLMDFEFRLRARTMRLLARHLGITENALVTRIALEDDDAILSDLAARLAGVDVQAAYASARTNARRQLIDELGDPTPVKLA